MKKDQYQMDMTHGPLLGKDLNIFYTINVFVGAAVII